LGENEGGVECARWSEGAYCIMLQRCLTRHRALIGSQHIHTSLDSVLLMLLETLVIWLSLTGTIAKVRRGGERQKNWNRMRDHSSGSIADTESEEDLSRL
jgi:uncharacterized protein HemY